MNYVDRPDAFIDTSHLIKTLETLREAEVDRELDEDERELLEAIEDLEDAYIEDWEHGAVLIHEDHFEGHARELAQELGLIPTEHKWPTSCIDWEWAARELAMDYTSVEFLGHTYYVR